MLTEEGRLGQTEVRVSRLGFGAAPIGNLHREMIDEFAFSIVAKALELGIRYFDTAPFYGMGLSETRLGAALAGGESSVVLSSKVGRRLEGLGSQSKGDNYGFINTPELKPVFDYSYDGVMKSYEASLHRLQCDHLDLLLAHDLGFITHGTNHVRHYRDFLNGGYRAMRELRDSGQVSAIGIAANEWQICSEALDHADFDCFLVAGRYTLLDQSAFSKFLPQCVRRKVTVVLGGPFNSGILAKGVKNAADGTTIYYDYKPAQEAVIKKTSAIESVCAEFKVNLASAALQFPLAHPKICSVIPGFSTPAEVALAHTLISEKIPSEFWQALKFQDLLDSAVPTPN